MKFKMMFFILLSCVLLLVGCQPKEYTISFLDWDETILVERKLKEGDKIVTPENPTRDGYVFIGWDKEFSTATKDLTVTAQYELASWTVTFIGFDNEALKEEIVTHNANATAPTVTPPAGYEFTGWDKVYSQITSDLIVTAQFRELTYNVRFFDDLGNLLKEETVQYGSDATAPSVSNRDQEDFSHWDKSFKNIKSNLDVNAVFVEKKYTIDFYDGNTKLSLGVNSYTSSKEVVLPIPMKTGYEFSGWFLSEISLYQITKVDNSIKGNLKLYSRWVKLDQNELTIPNNVGEFVKINKNPHSSGNGFVYQPQFPIGAPTTSVTQYNWASSNDKVATISAYSSISIASAGYAIITATLKTDPSVVYYCVIQTSAEGVIKSTLEEANAPSYATVTFRMSKDQSIQKTVQKGGFVVAPTPLAKDGYIFTGWVGVNQETIYNITKDTTFIPTYESGQKSYAGKTISVLGDSITTYAGYIPSGFAHFYPYPTADLGDVNQTWWMQFINHYGMKLLANNAWSGSAVAGEAASAAHKASRLEHLYIGEVKPDVILIFMGANDAGSPYITLNQFDEAYNKMIQSIKLTSPDSEIILCTLPSITMYSEVEQGDYNAVIKKYATSYGFTLLDFATAFTRMESSMYLVDSAHPNKAGMDKIAQVAIRDFGDVVK